MTKNDEKVLQKETELKEVKEKLESHEKVVGELDRQYQQALEEKSILAEQLQAETELCAEAEEMRARLVHLYRYITKIWISDWTFNQVILSFKKMYSNSFSTIIMAPTKGQEIPDGNFLKKTLKIGWIKEIKAHYYTN